MLPVHDATLNLLPDNLLAQTAYVVLYVRVTEVRHHRQRLPLLLLLAVSVHVDLYLSAEELASDLRVVIVRHLSEEYSLGECLDAGYGHYVLLMEGGVGGVRVGAGGLALLLAELLAEGLAQLLGGLAVDLTCEDVADGVEDDVGLLLGVVPHQLALVLCPEDDGYLVASGRGYEVVKSLDEDGGQLVEQHAARPLALVVDELEHPRGVERERRSVDGLIVGVVAHA